MAEAEAEAPAAGQPAARLHLARRPPTPPRTAPAPSTPPPRPIPDGNALTFSLSGGADRAAFAITAGGALSFAQSPDFEAPADADGNNVYLVQIAVSDGTTSAALDLAVTVTNVGPDAFRVTRVGTGFIQPLYLAAVPDGSGRVFVVEQFGRIRILDPATGAIAATPFLDLTGQLSTDGERGLLGFAPAPDFAATGTFYVFVTAPGRQHPAPPLPHPGRQSEPGRSGHRRHHPRHRPSAEQP